MTDKEPNRGVAKSPPASDLCRSMFEAYQLLQEAHIDYSQALTLAQDTEVPSDGMSTIQQKGRVYAEAVTRYSNAVMAWLARVEANPKDAVQLFPKGTAGNMLQASDRSAREGTSSVPKS